MVSYKVCLVLTVVSVSTNANFHYEHYKTFSFHGASDTLRKPWFYDEYTVPYSVSSSDIIPHYHGPYEGASSTSVALIHRPPFDSSSEVLFSASTKKIPREDKSFKKAISPFYTLTDKDDTKYKDIVLKSGVPYCQEIKTKRAAAGQTRSRRDAMTCYKCKDPKNGATYEQCSYSLKPQASTRVDDYVEIPSSFRHRRSNTNDENQSIASEAIVSSETKLGEPPFRFSEEYFLPEASHEVPRQYTEQTEQCDKVIKDSMICMVCKDTKTNGKYEQCSYSSQPNEKAYSYAKSSSFGKPQAGGTSSELKSAPVVDRKNYESTDSSQPSHSVHQQSPSRYSTGSGSKYTSSYPDAGYYEKSQVGTENVPQYKSPTVPADSEKQQTDSEGAKTADCKKITKDSMTCTVCKDSKTGGVSEQCSYAYEPSDKVYQYSRSKSFGGPDSKEQKSKPDYESDKSAEASDSGPYKSSGYSSGSPGSGSYYSDYSSPTYSGYYQPEESKNEKSSYYGSPPSDKHKSNSYSNPDSSDYIKSESEKVSENIKADKCEKVEKDGMTCTVCKDPSTGGNYEQCSYAYQPKDKIFSYTKAKSFGSPTEVEGEESPYGGKGESSQASYQLPDFSDSGSYGFATENKPYVATDDERSKTSSPSHNYKSSTADDDGDKRQASETQAPSKVDVEYFNTSKKKAEIEKFLQEFQKEDRSNCKKVMRNKMTCYQCVDESGFQKEECVFVAAPQVAPSNKVAYHEVKEFKLEPEDEVAKAANTKRETVEPRREAIPLEPAASASESHDSKEEFEDERPVEEEQTEDETDQPKEAEPYEYTSETRPKYDKRLGLTLPEYMLTTSEHEAEFDKIVSSSKI